MQQKPQISRRVEDNFKTWSFAAAFAKAAFFPPRAQLGITVISQHVSSSLSFGVLLMLTREITTPTPIFKIFTGYQLLCSPSHLNNYQGWIRGVIIKVHATILVVLDDP